MWRIITFYCFIVYVSGIEGFFMDNVFILVMACSLRCLILRYPLYLNISSVAKLPSVDVIHFFRQFMEALKNLLTVLRTLDRIVNTVCWTLINSLGFVWRDHIPLQRGHVFFVLWNIQRVYCCFFWSCGMLVTGDVRAKRSPSIWTVMQESFLNLLNFILAFFKTMFSVSLLTVVSGTLVLKWTYQGFVGRKSHYSLFFLY